MKATKYVTTKDCFFKKDELRPTDVDVVGAMRVVTEAVPLKDTFRGFGVAITGSSCYELNTMPEDKRRQFIKDIYGKDGLGLSIGRISIGSSDYSAELYSYDDVIDDRELKHFSVKKDEEYIIPMIKEILAENPDIMLYASPWSPPGWMKTGASMCGGYMRDEYIECYARYILKFLKEYEKHGINISAITPQNEPETTQQGKMPACVWHPDTEAKFILELRQKLIEDMRDTEIWMNDHSFEEWHRILWMLKEYPELIDESMSIAMHYYEGRIETVKLIQREYPDIKMHFTEGGPRLYDNYATDWCKWSIMMSKTLNNGLISFTGWNLMLDEYGGPNIGPFFCGGLATLNSQTGDITYSGQYRALSHFSKFIKTGAAVYPSHVEFCQQKMFTYPNISIPIESCVVKNTDGSVVLQLINGNAEKAQIRYFYGNKWWYIELLPDSVCTVVFDG